MAKSAAQLLYGPVLVFQSVVPLLTNLRIDILHPFVAVHVVCSTAVFVIFLVVTIDYKCPTPAAPLIPSENIDRNFEKLLKVLRMLQFIQK